jgi:hypothetical protein
MVKVAVASGLTVVALGALLAGPAAFAVLVLALALVVLLDLAVLLGRAGARPVLPVALVPGLVLPAMVACDVAADPAAGWDRIPGAFAVAVLLAFLLVLVFGRRGGAVIGLAATAVVSLLVGLGATGLILLRGLPGGFRWVVALGVLVLLADVAAPLVAAVRRRLDARGAEDRDATPDPVPSALDEVVPAVVAVAVAGGILAAAAGPPIEGLILVLLALVAVVAALGGAHLHRAISLEAGVDPAAAEPRVGEGLLVGALDAVMLAAPAAYVLARAVAL